MGNEITGAVRAGKERHEGKIVLETSELIFRGPHYRLKIAFAEMREVQAANGELRIDTKDGALAFEVGTVAEKWREKILHPKTRVQKLGVKDGTPVRLLGDFDADFIKELKSSKANVGGVSPTEAQNIFLAIGGKSSLATIAKHARKMKGAEALWLVYPKGKKEVTENDVLSAGRKSGLKDVKVVGFSSTHTALKFVIPVGKR
jgi:hypothetical protein